MNDYTMDKFHTEPGKVWYAGVRLLPQTANQYAGMSRKVWMTRDTADYAFADGSSVTGKLSSVYGSWEELRTELQNVLATTSTNVQSAGNALVGLADEIGGADGAAAKEIGDAEKQLAQIPVAAPKPGDAPDPDITRTHEKGSKRSGESGL